MHNSRRDGSIMMEQKTAQSIAGGVLAAVQVRLH
jgi:hypothetical protein